MKRTDSLFVFPALAVVLLDQASKILVSRILALHDSVTLIAGFFNLVHIRNRGMAFGFMNRPGTNLGYYLLLFATLVAVALLIFWFVRLRRHGPGMVLPLSLILGGALGNLIDRVRLREVIDFLDFYVGPYHWPAFNVADSAITLGTLWLAGCILFHRPPLTLRDRGQ